MVEPLEYIIKPLFVTFPLCVQSNRVKLGMVLVHSEYIRPAQELLDKLHPLTIRYPFAILGCSEERLPIEVVELTSEVDQYLISITGHALEEMLFLHERTYYDFKERIENNRTLAREVCGFANRRNGGTILLGITDDGKVVGVDKNELDSTKLKITSIVTDTCGPVPQFEINDFETADSRDKRLVIIRVHELERKPCMMDGRVYIRSGTSMRPASSDEIRKLLGLD